MRLFGLLVCLNLCACAARYVLSDSELNRAKKEESLTMLRVYVSNRMITVYGRDELNQTVIRREVNERRRARLDKRKLGRNKAGGIIEEDLRNGARNLWITWDARCGSKDCAYGFVQTEDGRYRLVELPEREEFSKPVVFRSCTIKRHKMHLEKLRSLSDLNGVYKLKRKRKRKRHKTVFLEYKKRRQVRKTRRTEREPGLN
jgi:hypothetical protein